MTYEPTNWKSGDVVTSAKLNKIEQGIAGGGVLIVNETDGILDKTWQEIYDAGFSVLLIDFQGTHFNATSYGVGVRDGTYSVGYMLYDEQGLCTIRNYTCDSASGYPEYQDLPIDSGGGNITVT